MAELGVFFSCEERSAAEIVRAARCAEEAGFQSAWISDHFHPWNDAQGESQFVWSFSARSPRRRDRCAG
jgi:alkanesulfonate monooxygenase SsuD/methylene tetrahydromethanopterin reductase-like flavin-dependent oxidoreductase (luciferase family)